jgi:RND family efflux transporter MFP subunit
MPRTESALVVEVDGRIEWVSEAMVSGGTFQAGMPLLRLDATDPSLALESAEASRDQAAAELANARFEYDRVKPLLDKRLVSRSALESAERRLRVAEAGLRAGESAVARAQRDLERTVLRAPFDGIVRQENIDVGQFVRRGSEIARLYATDAMEVRLPIADEQLAFLGFQLGQRFDHEQAPRVTLSAPFGGVEQRWEGRILRAEGELDARSRMVHLVARVESPEPALPLGLFVSATIDGTLAQDIITLPRSVLREGNQVIVIDEENRLELRPVTPLRFFEDDVLIQAGLTAGERVCLSPLQTVVEGMRVQPLEQGGAAQ